MNAPVLNILRKMFAVGCIATLSTPALAQVKPVDAVDDIVHIRKGQSVPIDVLSNDNSKTGKLSLKKVALVNNGVATIENDKIRFTPDPEFTGAAMLNYTVCNDNNECDCGLVYVDISEKPLLDYQEMKVFTVQGTSTKFTLPLGFKTSSAPRNGSVTENQTRNNEWIYTPNTNFKGTEYCSFSIVEEGRTKTFDVEFEVLPKQAQYISPDIAYTRIGRSTSFNVLANDNYSVIGLQNITFGPCTGGTIDAGTDGKVTFTPNLPKGGKATFTYTATLGNGEKETAQVIIFVSDYMPSKDQYRLVCSGSPLAIQYSSPLTDYKLEVLREETKAKGTVKFYPYIDEIIWNKRIKGKNILLYLPNLNGRDLRDEFYVKYCADNNNCSDYLTISVDLFEPQNGDQCVEGCVWPGDANADGQVNVLDLFNIAQSLGEYGHQKARSQDNSDNAFDWYGHSAANWGKTSYNNVDLKYADTNGDGIISVEDVDGIIQNYGNYSTITPEKTVEDFDVDVQLIPTMGAARGGDLIEIMVAVGSAQNPAYNAKGLSFSVKYDPQYIKEGSIAADFKAYNWLSRYDAYLPLSKVTERGVLQAGMARSKGKSTSGHGQVGSVRAVVEDYVAGIRGNDKTTVQFRLENVMLMKENGQLVALPDAEVEIPLILGKKADPLKNDDLVMYPNPASDMINFQINGVNTIEYVRLLDAAGREVTRLNKVNAKSATIPVDASMRGFYLAEVMTEKGRIIKKLEIIR